MAKPKKMKWFADTFVTEGGTTKYPYTVVYHWRHMGPRAIGLFQSPGLAGLEVEAFRERTKKVPKITIETRYGKVVKTYAARGEARNPARGGTSEGASLRAAIRRDK